MRGRHRVDGERGETLLELLIAIAILGVCGVAIASTMAVSIHVSAIHRGQANLGTLLHNYAEQLDATPYSACTAASTPDYTLTRQPGFTAPTISIAYWTGSSFGSTSCPGSGDPGVQRVTVAVGTADGQTSDSIAVVLRRR